MEHLKNLKFHSWIHESLENLPIRIIKTIFAILLAFLVPVFLLIFFLPIHFARYCVKRLAKIIRPELGKMINCSGTTVAHGSNTLKNPRLAIVCKEIFKGRIDYDRIIKVLISRVVNLENSKGERQYPEMSQYLTSWWGFQFWKWDTNFDITNHITIKDLGKPIVTLDDIRDIEEELIQSPFKEERSPWNIILVHNVSMYGKDKEELNTAVIHRLSHVLGDGYSFLKLTESYCEASKVEQIKPKYAKKSLIENIIFPMKCLYVLADIIVEMFTKYPFKVSSSTRTFKDSLQRADVISVQTIKDIKNNANVSFTSVIISIATGAFRSMALRNGMKLPKTLPSLIPMPRPGHPSKLRNHFTMAAINLPVGEPDPAKRLQLCNKEYERVKSSAYPTVVYLWMVLAGGCFNFIGRILCQTNSSPVNLSYVPMGWSQCFLDGHELLTHTFCYAPSGAMGSGIFISSVLDHLTFYAVADSTVLPKEQVLAFKSTIQYEVDILTNLPKNGEI